MALVDVTDAEIAALTPRQRQELMWRLARPTAAVAPPLQVVRDMRRRRIGVITISIVLLIPWTCYLGLTLPTRHVARDWTLTWVGFNVGLLSMFSLTAGLGILRRQLVIPSALACGVLLICDAWFDVTTADSSEIWISIASAALIELPLATLAIISVLRVLRMLASRLWLLDEGGSLWSVRIPLDELLDRTWQPGYKTHMPTETQAL
jgi:hypothetical protein